MFVSNFGTALAMIIKYKRFDRVYDIKLHRNGDIYYAHTQGIHVWCKWNSALIAFYKRNVFGIQCIVCTAQAVMNCMNEICPIEDQSDFICMCMFLQLNSDNNACMCVWKREI